MPEAVEIADALFTDENAKGMIRLQEHAQIERVQLLEISEFVKGYSDSVPEEGLGHIQFKRYIRMDYSGAEAPKGAA